MGSLAIGRLRQMWMCDMQAMSNPVTWWPHRVQDTLHARRKAAAIVRGDSVMHKLFTEFATRYRERSGGYTRILQTRRRPNDCAQMAYIE